MNESIEGKKILLFCPDFFDYYKDIEEQLKNKGASVTVILENFVNKSVLYRFFWVKKEKTKYYYTNRYYNQIIDRLKEQYDYIFVIRGEALNGNHLTKLQKKYPDAKFIMYQWDSVNNNPNSLKIADFFDSIYTFDMEDAKKYNWEYRPLFYITNKQIDMEKKNIDISLVGTLYYKRARLSQLIKKYCTDNNLKPYVYLYSPRIVYLLHTKILRDDRYCLADNSDVRFNALDRKQISDIYSKSKILIDYTADDQVGLTMRTIESIGYKCKLITNNKKIKETNIYKYGNIYVYDIDDFYIPRSFIEGPFKDISNEEKYYYSLDGWINTIFS